MGMFLVTVILSQFSHSFLLPSVDLCYYSLLKVRSFLPPLAAVLWVSLTLIQFAQLGHDCLLREKDTWGHRVGSGLQGKESSFVFFGSSRLLDSLIVSQERQEGVLQGPNRVMVGPLV